MLFCFIKSLTLCAPSVRLGKSGRGGMYSATLRASSSGGRLGIRGLDREISNITYERASTYCCPSRFTGAADSGSDPASDFTVCDVYKRSRGMIFCILNGSYHLLGWKSECDLYELDLHHEFNWKGRVNLHVFSTDRWMLIRILF